MRIELEKVSAELAASGANGGSLRVGEISGTLWSIVVSNYYIKRCVEKTDIDASFATDIIPRGCEVRQAWQNRWSVPNAKG